MIEVIDLFAGPGGLGEGFSSFKDGSGQNAFKIKISIEKEKFAHETLTLRSFYRQFSTVPKEYYDYLRGKISKETLFSMYPSESKNAKTEAYRAELGAKSFPHEEVIKRIRNQVLLPKNSIVIGGPPCQAYSLIGRSAMSKRDGFESDPRHTLYKEYLRIIADIQPAVLIMENVKGILSSKLDGEYIFDRILSDIQTPIKIKTPNRKRFKEHEKYTIYSLSSPHAPHELKRDSFIIKSEDYGIPQCRHRVILLAVRNDLKFTPSILSPSIKQVNATHVLNDLPAIRSGLSKEIDGFAEWKKTIKNKFKNSEVLENLTKGGEFIPTRCKPEKLAEWFYDKNLGGVINHSARSHIAGDIHRYYFCAKFTQKHNRSPKLEDFPEDLLPNHKNIKSALKTGSLFNDRFRVQIADRPSTTITSHISKDGHSFIHYDPRQSRSLTVREAARLQTFPDNYKFEGPRTSQYQQVGNAVPPLLAYKIARIVHELACTGTTDSK